MVKEGSERKRRKEDKEAFERIKEGIADTEEDHLDLDLRHGIAYTQHCSIGGVADTEEDHLDLDLR